MEPIWPLLQTHILEKAISFRGGFAPLTSHQGLCPLDPAGGLRPQTPVIGSRSRALHGNPNPPFTNPAYTPVIVDVVIVLIVAVAYQAFHIGEAGGEG